MRTLLVVLLLTAAAFGQELHANVTGVPDITVFQSNGLNAKSTAIDDIQTKGIIVSFTATPPSAEFTRFHWWFGDKLESSDQNPKHIYFFSSLKPTGASGYLVHLRMSSADGHKQAHAEVIVKINPPVEFIDPNTLPTQ